MPDKKKLPAVLNYLNDSVDISISDPRIDIHEAIALKPSAHNESIKIGVNIDFMKDALKATTDETITFCMNGSLNPIVIKDGLFKQVVLPMRLKG